jgi:ligand-binding SRPBCC domain-containing protein
MSAAPELTVAPAWARWWLYAAGVYNLLWGAAVIAFPDLLFDLTGARRTNYPEIWQCVGMIVGVYGVGYLIAAGDPRTHWPIVFVGLLGKIFGPVGFAVALWKGTFPPLFGLTILTNDLLWWAPFGMILYYAATHPRGDRPAGGQLLRFVKESRINAPPDVVFRFHESPDALTKLIPPWEPMRVAESAGSLKPGSKVVLSGRVGLLAVRWVALHTEYEPPHLFADRQVSGPFAWWYHRHRFLDDGQGGTILRDEVEYLPPLGWLGRWLGGPLVRGKLEKMFAYRHDTTRRMIESGEWAGADPLPAQQVEKDR